MGDVFLEIKNIKGDFIHKERVGVPPSAWPALLYDPGLVEDLTLPKPERRVVYKFIRLCLELKAQPTALVRYERAPILETVEDLGRLSFDGGLMCAAPVGWSLAMGSREAAWRPIPFAGPEGAERLMEFKHLGAAPRWFRLLSHQARLVQRPFSKYRAAVEALER